MCDEENSGGGEEDQGGGAVLIRIHVPDLNIHKCLQFYRHDLVWDVKQQCLASLPKELKESFNYGLFAPPCNGKAGKFLDEERPLSDYPFSGPVGYLELRYKRRLYKGLSVDEKQLKSLHTKSNLKRFLDYVSSGHADKVTKMCSKGLDPNFHCPETGETPLSMAAVMKKPSKLLIALVNGGALLDYRTKEGSTAMHRSVEAKSLEAVKTMLDLGGSPNYRDAKGLTPLYISVAANADPALCEALLHDHAFLGAQDLQGWHETHQACRNGLIHHLEHLLYYGADMNAKNASGNTPLHVCAVNNQESCARLLLFRGANKEALNFANQTPYQVAIIAGNMELAEIIQNHRSQDVDKSLDHSDITSDSSGVGTCNSGGSGSSYDPTPTDASLILPGMMVVCVENFESVAPDQLKLIEGDIIEVTASTDSGFLEGSLRGQVGYFPASCVQEIRMKNYENRNQLVPPQANRGGKWKKDQPNKQPAKTYPKKIWGEPHTVILHRGQKGFGFVLRGAKSDSPLMELKPADRFPALQYLDDVDVGGVADRAGLRKGDFILSINGTDVSQMSHEVVVDYIRKSGELVSIAVVGLSSPIAEQETSKPGSPASLTCDQSSGGTPKAQYHFATLPRKFSAGSAGPIVPSPPRRDPATSLSVGRARAKSMVAALAELGVGQNMNTENAVAGKASSVDSIPGKPPLPPTNSSASNGVVVPKTASIRARPASSRITATEIQQIFEDKVKNGEANGKLSPDVNCHKIYASVAEMKRSKSGLKGKEAVTLHKDFHSSPDLKELERNAAKTATAVDAGALPEGVKALSQENLSKLRGNPRHSWACIATAGHSTLTERNYESSWKRIEKIPGAPGEKKILNKDAESEGSLGSSSSDSETEGGEASKPQKASVLADGEYRTIKPLRPIQSKTLPRRASTGCTIGIGPIEQQTIINLVPPGQMVKVDVSKSKEYASLDIASTLKRREGNSVMSSFKPMDSAKLYEVPGDIRTIGYRDSQGEAESGSNNANQSDGTLKSSNKSNGENSASKMEYAKPDVVCTKRGKQEGTINGGSNETDARQRAKITGDSKPESEADFDPQRSLQEAKERLKPVLKGSLINNNSSETKIRIEVKQSPRLARKSEKTVTFQSELPQQQTPTGQMSHSLSVDEFQRIKSNLKISKSFPNDLGADDGDGNSSSGVSSDGGPDVANNINATGKGGNFVTSVAINPDSDSSEDSSDKTWILKDENGTPTDTDSLPPPPPSLCAGINSTKNKTGASTQPQIGSTNSVMSNGAQNHAKQQGVQNSTYAPVNRLASGRPPPGGNLTKNAVSLTKLPPPMEMESESEERSPILKKPQPAMTPNVVPQSYHTLQPQRSKPMHPDQRQVQFQGQMQGPTRQAEKSIEESLQLIRMHVAALKQDFPSMSPTSTSQTPILAPPPEFSDPRDNYEQATRFNQTSGDPSQPFNRQSPLYRTISHTHSSSSSMYSGYPTMTRQQQYQQQQHNHMLQQHQQQLHQAQQQYQQQQMQQRVVGQPGQPQQLQLIPQHHHMIPQNQMTMSMPQTYHTLGRIPSSSYSSNPAQNMLNTSNQYQTLQQVKSQQPVQHHHPKCMYFYQGQGQPQPQGQSSTAANSGGKYIPEKLHPVNRYTPDIGDSSGPRIVGTIPKKPPQDHYEIPHHAQQQLLQQQIQQQHLQQMQQNQGSSIQRIRREFRNKALPDWTVLDACDWLDSLFMPEYKEIFQERAIDGKKLLRIDNSVLLELGIKKLGHRMNIEKSLKRYLPQSKS